jgi:hypothetical protein
VLTVASYALAAAPSIPKVAVAVKVRQFPRMKKLNEKAQLDEELFQPQVTKQPK